jgi:hypothetical protein
MIVTCTVPPNPRYFLPVRIEIQRGTSADRIDRQVHTFELSAAKSETSADPKDRKDNPAATNRTQRDPLRGSGRRNVAKPAPALSFQDTNVNPRQTYYYRARLLTRLPETKSGSPIIFMDSMEMDVRWLAEGKEQVLDPTDGTTLYAGPWSPVTQATVPTDLQLRYQCVTRGTLPASASAQQTGYSVFLGVRVWDAHAQAWSESNFEVVPGQPVKGRLRFKVGTETNVHEFDTGLVLQSVQRATKIRIDRKTELVTKEQIDEDGKMSVIPSIDRDGKLVTTERRHVTRIPTEIAILKANDTGRETRLVKGFGYEEVLPAGMKLVMESEPEPSLTSE